MPLQCALNIRYFLIRENAASTELYEWRLGPSSAKYLGYAYIPNSVRDPEGWQPEFSFFAGS